MIVPLNRSLILSSPFLAQHRDVAPPKGEINLLAMQQWRWVLADGAFQAETHGGWASEYRLTSKVCIYIHLCTCTCTDAGH